jgi:hypothetical protein
LDSPTVSLKQASGPGFYPVFTNLWALCREKDEFFLEVRFSQMSTPACMAFMVPDNWSGDLLLRFGDGTATVLRPAAK